MIDLAGVEAMDTAALAVLVEALREAKAAGRKVFLYMASESVRKIFELAGLRDALLSCVDCLDSQLGGSA